MHSPMLVEDELSKQAFSGCQWKLGVASQEQQQVHGSFLVLFGGPHPNLRAQAG